MAAARMVVGAMTGTSLDGLDLALARVEGTGLGLRATLVAEASAPLGALAPRLRAAAEQVPLPASEFAALARELADLHARCARELCASVGVQPDLACVHGQTIFHRPPLSWQLFTPQPLAAALNCPVVCDLRGADLAEGGQGAPLTPLADWVLFRAAHPRAVVNLGGFANATLLPADEGAHEDQVAAVRGRDLCACNQLLDRAARTLLHQPFDAGGAAASRGTPHPQITADLQAALTPGRARSLGTGDEAWSTLDRWAAHTTPENVLASVAFAIGHVIGGALHEANPALREIIVAGGGAHHALLVRALAQAAGATVVPSSVLGVPIGMREALGWAVLGALAQDGVQTTLPAVTGRISSRLSDGVWCLPTSAEPVLYTTMKHCNLATDGARVSAPSTGI